MEMPQENKFPILISAHGDELHCDSWRIQLSVLHTVKCVCSWLFFQILPVLRNLKLLVCKARPA